jgi:hypothetical protein
MFNIEIYPVLNDDQRNEGAAEHSAVSTFCIELTDIQRRMLEAELVDDAPPDLHLFFLFQHPEQQHERV